MRIHWVYYEKIKIRKIHAIRLRGNCSCTKFDFTPIFETYIQPTKTLTLAHPNPSNENPTSLSLSKAPIWKNMGVPMGVSSGILAV